MRKWPASCMYISNRISLYIKKTGALGNHKNVKKCIIRRENSLPRSISTIIIGRAPISEGWLLTCLLAAERLDARRRLSTRFHSWQKKIHISRSLELGGHQYS